MDRQLRAAGLEPVAQPQDLRTGERALTLDGRWMLDQRLLSALAGADGAVGVRAPDGGWVAVAGAVSAEPAGDPGAHAATLKALTEIGPSSIDDYVQTSRRRVPVRLSPWRTMAEVRAAEAAIVADAQKGVLDWPARFIHAPIENLTVRLLWPTAVTPNQISLATFFLGLAAAALFVLGHFASGLVLALVIGALDGVDGKLARTKLMVTPAGEWEHVGDKIVEYGWYLCLGYGLVRTGAPMAVFYAGLLAAVAMGVDIAICGAAQRRLGRQIDDLGPVERFIRLIGARRNTHMWLLVPFALLGAWDAGLAAIAGSAVLTVFAHLWRWNLAERRRLSA